MDHRYAINAPVVASEVINGEAIMMHHGSGNYFSANGIGAVVWQWIGQARSHDQMVRGLEAGFPNASVAIKAGVDSFLAELLKHELIRQTAPGDGPAIAVPPQQGEELMGEFAAPVLNVYSDMRDVLLLDPIHEVEEASGWPMPKRANAKP